MTGARDEESRPLRAGNGSTEEPESLLLYHVGKLRHPTGRAAAHRFVFETYYDRLRGFFRRQNLPPETAEDLTQDTFVRVLKGRGEFASAHEFEGWIFRIAANVYKNHQRGRHTQKRRAPERSLEQWMEAHGPDVPEPPESETESPLDAFLQHETRVRLARELLELPHQMRRCLALRIYQDWPYQEIADHLGVSIGTVKAHLHQGKTRLTERLRPDPGSRERPGEEGPAP